MPFQFFAGNIVPPRPAARPAAIKPSWAGSLGGALGMNVLFPVLYPTLATPQSAPAMPSNLDVPGVTPGLSAPKGLNIPTLSTPASLHQFDADPGVLGAQAEETAGITRLDALLRNQRAQELIAFGDPTLAAKFSAANPNAAFTLDDNTAAAARANYQSGNALLARIDKARDLQRQGVLNNLAARGMLHSGALGYKEGQVASAYGNTLYDATNASLAHLGNYLQNYLDRREGLHATVTNAYNQAYQAYMQQQMLAALLAALASQGGGGGGDGGGGGGGGGGGAAPAPDLRPYTQAPGSGGNIVRTYNGARAGDVEIIVPGKGRAY